MLRNLLFLLCAIPGMAAAEAPSGIPEELLHNSDAVIRLSSTEFVYSSPHAAVEKHRTQTTILKSSAAYKGNFVCTVDPTRSLKSFSGTICDAQGRVIRKLKRSELQYTEFSWSSLADDTGFYVMEVHVPTVPYTVNIEYEITHKDGILTFPPFLPVTSSKTALEKGIYTLSLPQGMSFNYKCSHIGEPEKSSADGRDIYRWTIQRVGAIREESASPDLIDRIPYVYAAPADFQFEGTVGSMRDWTSFGSWQWKLLQGRDILPDALKQEIHNRTDSLASPREKVRALYEYMGQTTRYVSIQLGIGGLQPMPAAEVFRTKFGDCKALSNYLRAMLAECGIASDYAIIHTNQPRMHRDFASANQANHAILRVPLDRDTLWLECTNTDVPFGYVHNDIAGHDAVLIGKDGGRFVTLPDYADTLHRMVQQVELTIAADGSATGHVSGRYEAGQYEQMMGFPKADADKQTERLLKALKLPLVSVSDIICTETRTHCPAWKSPMTSHRPGMSTARATAGSHPCFRSANWADRATRSGHAISTAKKDTSTS